MADCDHDAHVNIDYSTKNHPLCARVSDKMGTENGQEGDNSFDNLRE